MTKHRSKARGKKAKNEDERTDLIEKLDMVNERFFGYYKAQKIVPDEEWDDFVEALRQHLPTTFRVTGSRQTAQTLNAIIGGVHVPTLSDVVFEDQRIPPPVQIPWYPDGLAWQFNVPKKVLRKSPEFKRFHSFLVFETEVGNVSRQEAVSMLPPLFLDVEPHHKVMDMCAAPGSKTAQILEALHAQDTCMPSAIPSGLLLANDSDSKRTHLLIHQSARLPSPAFMVTNLDASNYPSIRVPISREGKTLFGPLLFDRILCDVPCSGDGTIRKNMGIWKTWKPMDANGLHSLQVRILLRAMKMLTDGGRIVYSTCSLNPVENEAVIAEALTLNRSFELLDVSSRLVELDRRPGLTSWRPTVDRSCARTFESYEELLSSSVDEHLKVKITEGHFPPQDAALLNLHRCLRIYPHLQDTGGFFIAVLQKSVTGLKMKKERKREGDEIDSGVSTTKRIRFSEDASSVPIIAADGDDQGREQSRLEETVENCQRSEGDENVPRVSDSSFKENPYVYLSENDPALLSCLERLHIKSAFPSCNVFVRNPEGEAARSLYISNDVVKTIIQHNNYERIRLTSAGTKVFAKQDGGKSGEAQYRFLGESLPVILPYIESKAVIEGDMACLRILLESNYPLCERFSHTFRSTIEATPIGSHVVRFSRETDEDLDTSPPRDLVLPIWKSNVSLTLMIDKKAKSALSLRVFGSDMTTAQKAGSDSQPK